VVEGVGAVAAEGGAVEAEEVVRTAREITSRRTLERSRPMYVQLQPSSVYRIALARTL
jgi:hypothetical protein